MLSPSRLDAAYQTALAALLKERRPEGHWVGELSSSALSTATAVMALVIFQKQMSADGTYDVLIDDGLRWLIEHQNEDGGWGDTVKSLSNISTTMLCRAAFHLAGQAWRPAERQNPRDSLRSSRGLEALQKAEKWLFERYGNTPALLAEAVRARYGVDRTFATPILMTCALAGLVSWDEVPPLPFELAYLPQSWFRFVRLHVVSYALPALIAVGQVIYCYKKPKNPLVWLIRALSRGRTLRVLSRIQPSSGGFLEAIPLTSFVTLSLAACGLARHEVCQKGVQFLLRAARPDGSWAIDSDLSTWVTTLSINALAAAAEVEKLDRKEELLTWLISQQHMKYHPYTGAAPGGFAWTPLPGGVPDGDDTPGALMAGHNLLKLSSREEQFQRPAKFETDYLQGFIAATHWLLRLQNADGGWPTFCRGWGHLPFDRSGTDLTAHVLRAIACTDPDPAKTWSSVKQHYRRLFSQTRQLAKFPLFFKDDEHRELEFLSHSQRPDGSWIPLWFGCQHAPDDENPTYGTARVLAAYRDLGMMDSEPARKGVAWLLSAQNADGGWGGAKNTPSTIEETALALEILLDAQPPGEPGASATGVNASVTQKALHWLVEQVEKGGLEHPSPIGFYFAKLWYFEKLYPIIFTVAALGRARRKMSFLEPEAPARA